jgi:hypothetical protein
MEMSSPGKTKRTGDSLILKEEAERAGGPSGGRALKTRLSEATKIHFKNK